MNAATFTTPAKGLILATGLIAASTLMVSAADLTVPLGSQASNPLANAYLSPPTGLTTLGGHKFDMSTGNYILLSGGQKASYSGSWANAKDTFLLLNSGYTYLSYQGVNVGSLTLTFSDATTQTQALVVGKNLREWRPAGTNTVNTASDPSWSNVWSGTAQSSCGGGSAVIDMVTMTVPTAGKTLTGLTLTNADLGGIAMVLSGVTVDDAPVVLTGGGQPGKTGDDTDNRDVNRVNPPTKHGKVDVEKKEPTKPNDDKNGAKNDDKATAPQKKPVVTPKPKPISARHKGDEQSNSQRSDG